MRQLSYQAVKAVLELSSAKGPARLALLILAEAADPHGRNAFPSVGTIAKRMRVNSRSASTALSKLRRSGEIVGEGQRPSGTRIYRITCVPSGGAEIDTGQKRAAADTDTLGVQDLASGGAGIGAPKVQLSSPEPPRNDQLNQEITNVVALPKVPSKGDPLDVCKDLLSIEDDPSLEQLRWLLNCTLSSELTKWIEARIDEGESADESRAA